MSNNLIKRNTKKSPVDIIAATFRTIYARQVSSDINSKTASLQRAIDKKTTDVYTKDVFEQEIAGRIDLLLSSARFREEIESLGLDLFNAATHVVLLGWQYLADYILRRNGVELEPYIEWKDPMFDRATIEHYVPHIRKMLESSK